ncbi:hypothetical protein EPO33_03880 [Patescibacteria group bacterium]|nr:MAG: hypothetical protein EPO33_03880 [Patescibacteria group bacterium]
MIVRAIKTRVFLEGENVHHFIAEHVRLLHERSILVVTSKIVALAEGRTATPASEEEKAALIRSESSLAIPTTYCWLTVRDGMVMPSAGVDESNGNGKTILLPRDSYVAASALRETLLKTCKLRHLGVLVTDSRTLPLRAGVTGVAMGYAGFRGIRDYRGKPDIFGRLLRMSRTNVADSLAAAAVLLMGEGAEQQPLAIVEDAPVEFSDIVDRGELAIDIRDDMYRPLFTNIAHS